MIKDKIKIYLQNYPKFYTFAKNFYFFIYFSIYKISIFCLRQLSNKLGFSKRYKKLESFKNSKNGRCFIVATGPSLTKEDLQKLKNETTFGVNALVKWFPEIGWETTYYAIQDVLTYKKLKHEIDSINTSIILFSLESGLSSSEYNKIVDIKNKNNSCEYPLYYRDHLYSRFKYQRWNTKFSDNASRIIYDGYTVVYSLIQIAVYMGYKEIYLLGTDCNYKTEKSHAIDYGYQKRDIYKIQGDRMIFSYYFAKNYADSHGIKIYNATRGGMLEVFPRVDLDEVLKNKGGSK